MAVANRFECDGPSVHGYSVPTKLYLNVRGDTEGGGAAVRRGGSAGGGSAGWQGSHEVEYCRNVRDGAKEAIMRGLLG